MDESFVANEMMNVVHDDNEVTNNVTMIKVKMIHEKRLQRY